MTRTSKHFQLTIIAGTAAMAGGVWAQDAEVQELIKPSSTLSAGIGNWSADRRKLGVYDGMREGKTYGLLDLDYVRRDDANGTWTTFNARNLGLDSREIRAEWLRQGDVGASLEYSRTPRDNPLRFTTGLQGIGTTFQTISGAGAAALPAREVELGTTRDATQLGIYKRLQRDLELKVSFKNEERDGTRHWGLGSNPYFLTEPIDSTTRLVDVVLDYSGERLQLSGGYNGSWYDNANSMVWGLINGAAQPGTTQSPNPTPLTLPLDNQAHNLFLNGGYSLTPTTRASFKLSYGRATQDEQLPTWDLAAPNNRFTLTPSHLDGRIDTTLVEGTLTAQPLPKLSVLANLRYHDAKDKTPLAPFAGSNITLIPTVYNTPHSIKTTSGKLEANYRLPNNFGLSAGIDYREQDRSAPTVGTLFVPFRREIDETTYRLRLRRAMSETISGSLAYMHSKREGSPYVLTGDAMEDDINPIHIADRKRDKWRAALDWSPLKDLALQFALEDSRDEYGPADQQGLQDGTAQLFSVDATYTLNDKWQLNGWYARDDTQVREFGFREATGGAANAQKDARLREVGNSFGLGLRGEATAALKVGGNLEWLYTVSEHRQNIALLGAGAVFPTNAGVTLVPLPDIANRVVRLKLFAQYALRKDSDLRVDLMHERWRGDEWTWRFANGSPFVYGTVADGTVTDPPMRETANFIGARYIHRFQ